MIEWFDKDGPLARAIRGYRPRAGQIAMAQSIADKQGRQVLEAGTGIGKTFAYLAPILHNRLSAIVSTGTRALQDQLFLRDIPFLARVLKRPINAVMLKGRANYICRRNLANPVQSQLFAGNDDWARVLEFANNNEDGDIRAATGIAANSRVWTAAVSVRETCPAKSCDFYDSCFLYRARARAQKADIVVVNHHLFLSDMRLREDDVAELLPQKDIVVFDEAHLLPSLAPQYFGESITAADMLRILAEIDRQATRTALSPGFMALTKKWRAAIGALLESSEHFAYSTPAKNAIAMPEWHKSLQRLQETMNAARDSAIDGVADLDAEIGEWFANIAARIAAAADKLQRWQTLAANPNAAADDAAESESPPVPSVCWAQKNDNSVELHSAPVSGRDIFRRAWDNHNNIVMTSATLCVGDSFDNFMEETGMENAHAQSWQSPFDFANRSLLYLPPQMPDPNQPGYTEATIRAAVPLIRANGGRAFILFSSWRALHEGAVLLHNLLEDNYQILKQGDAANDELLRQFRQTPNAVLAGSLSFWQGVDVKGGALSLVVVDKIPFIPPNNPLLAARDEWRKKRDEDAFKHNQIPPAAILMKQVAGRLMRDFDDWGVFVACDPRLTRRGYGKIILNSLPPMKRTDDAQTAADFLRAMQPSDTSPADNDN